MESIRQVSAGTYIHSTIRSYIRARALRLW
jgi:hypothetical protein